MLRLIRNKIRENSLAHKAKRYWKNCEKWPLKDICTDIYLNQIKAAKDFYLPLLPKNASILDLGCGDGWFSFEIATAASHIDAIDISENLIQIAKHTQKINKINNVNFTVGEVDQVIAANTLYDSVMCMGLFTCILKDYVMSKIITDITSKLKPNGILLVRDSFNKTVTQLFEQEGYVAVYRREDHYTRLFTDKGFELCDEGQLSDSISDTGYFSGFKIFRKV